MVDACEKFVLVLLMFVLFAMLLFAVPNCVHVPELLLHHVAFMVSPVSLSVQFTYSVGTGHILVCPLVGDAPVWYGAWLVLVVKWYVLFV